jgi:hypothetical protein
MKKSIIILFVLISSFSFGQNNGFLGKKNFISAEMRVYTPMIYGLFSIGEEQYKNDGGAYAPKKNFIDYGFNFSYGRALSRNVGIILQYGISYYDFSYSTNIGYVKNPGYAADEYYNNYSEFLNKSNWFKAKSTTFMPIIEMTNGSGLLPLGLTHQLGFGFSKHKFIEDNYHIQFIENDGVKNYTPKNLFDYENNFVRSYTMMYKVNLRVPITEFLLFNVGIRYNLNMVPGSLSFYNYTNDNYVIGEDQFLEMVKNKEFSNIMSLETGLSLCF